MIWIGLCIANTLESAVPNTKDTQCITSRLCAGRIHGACDCMYRLGLLQSRCTVIDGPSLHTQNLYRPARTSIAL